MPLYGICPFDKDEWEKVAADRSIGSLHGFTETSSASKLDVDQFLALKTLWQVETNINVLLADGEWSRRLGTTAERMKEAREEMKKEDAWNKYLCALTGQLQPNARFSGNLGRFALVLQNHLIVKQLRPAKSDSVKVEGSPMRTRSGLQVGAGLGSFAPWGPGVRSGTTNSQPRNPSPAGQGSRSRSNPSSDSSRDVSEASCISGPDYALSKAERAAIADEQVVNTAAISFLQSLFVHDIRNAYWSPQRIGFRFGNTDFKAYTDGHLQICGDTRSAALLEVKARLRPTPAAKHFKIEWQESAQMALWIRDEPFSYWTTEQDRRTCRRILISQDRLHMYLTIAEYEDSYLHYLQGETSLEGAGFLTMHRLGPFQTGSSSNMNLLAGALKVLIPYAATFPPAKKSRSPSPTEGPRSASREPGRQPQTPQASRPTGRESPRGRVAERFQDMDLNRGTSRSSSESLPESPSRGPQQRHQASRGHPSTTESSGQGRENRRGR